MKALLGLLFTFLAVNLAVIASGIGIGFVLRWVLPSVDLGAGILIGVVSTGLSIHYFHRLMTFSELFSFRDLEDDDFDSSVRIYPVGSTRSGRKRRRK